jgi:hypothetical protein
VLSSFWMAVVGCASVYTAVDDASDVGVAYYMPNQAIRIEIAIDKEGAITPKALAGVAYPDTSHRYLMRSQTNPVGVSNGKVEVNTRGLLTSAVAESKSQISDALKNAAASAGAMRPSLVKSATPVTECARGTTHTYEIPVEFLEFKPVQVNGQTAQVAKGSDICGYGVTILRLPAPAPVQARTASPGDRAGLYYRQALPYIVTLSRAVTSSEPVAPAPGAGNPKTKTAPAPPPTRNVTRTEVFTFLVHSPTGAPTLFAPLPRTVFAATNKTTLSFEDGMLKEYDRSVDGELVGALKLPADVLGAYTTALASAFTSRKTQAANETEERLRENERALTDLRIQLCRDAVASGEAARIEAACAAKKN